MSYTALKTIRPFFTDACGRLLAGGRIYTYEANSLTLKATFKDAGGATENTNPIVLDASGEADIYINSDYRFQIFDRYGVLINDVNHIAPTQRVSSEFIQDPSGMTFAQIADDVMRKANSAIQQVEGKLSITDLVNNLTTGGTDKALTAEMGKSLLKMFVTQSAGDFRYFRIPNASNPDKPTIVIIGSVSGSITANVDVVCTFPYAFPNIPPLMLVCNGDGVAALNSIISVSQNITTSGFSWRSNNSGATRCNYIAIGN